MNKHHFLERKKKQFRSKEKKRSAAIYLTSGCLFVIIEKIPLAADIIYNFNIVFNQHPLLLICDHSVIISIQLSCD